MNGNTVVGNGLSIGNPLVSKSSWAMNKCLKVGEDENIPSKIRKIIRKYTYINLGFTFTNVNDEHRPQCVICFEILSNQSIKASLLKRHFNIKHSTLQNKNKNYFIPKLTEMKGTQKSMSFLSVVFKKQRRHPS